MYTNSRFKSTPYRKTPSFRRITVTNALVDDEELSEEEREKIQNDRRGLVKRQMKVYKITPLHRFSLARMRHYARSLSSFVQSRTKDASLEENIDVATFRELSGLQQTLENPVAIAITLKQRQPGGGMREVLTAALCCVGPEIRPSPDSFTHYPLMLCTGRQASTLQLSDWLSNEFDCCVSEMSLSQNELSWLVALFSSFVADETTMTTMIYHLPPSCAGLDTVHYEINTVDCNRIWSSIHDSNRVEVEEEEVCLFIVALEEHFFQHLKLNLAAFQLEKIGTTLADITSKGHLKLHHEDHVLLVLAQLTEIALNHLRL